MKKMLNVMPGKKILRVVLWVVVLIAALITFYTIALMPIIEKGQRAACHSNYAAEAQQYGQQIMEANQENAEISEAELSAQVNQLVQQRYDTNYALCLRSLGL